jgi:hypothetical protein
MIFKSPGSRYQPSRRKTTTRCTSFSSRRAASTCWCSSSAATARRRTGNIRSSSFAATPDRPPVVVALNKSRGVERPLDRDSLKGCPRRAQARFPRLRGERDLRPAYFSKLAVVAERILVPAQDGTHDQRIIGVADLRNRIWDYVDFFGRITKGKRSFFS